MVGSKKSRRSRRRHRHKNFARYTPPSLWVQHQLPSLQYIWIFGSKKTAVMPPNMCACAQPTILDGVDAQPRTTPPDGCVACLPNKLRHGSDLVWFLIKPSKVDEDLPHPLAQGSRCACMHTSVEAKQDNHRLIQMKLDTRLMQTCLRVITSSI